MGLFVALAHALYAGPSHGDDTFIYMRYVAHALQGHGIVFNVGESSYGTTSLLWPLLMIPLSAVLGLEVAVWKAVGAFLCGVRGAVLVLLFARLGARPGWAIGLAGFALLDAFTFRWGASGMENGLTAAMLALCAWTFVAWWQRPAVGWGVAFGAVAALSPFVRPELALLSLMLAGAAVWRCRSELRAVLPLLATFVALGVVAVLSAKLLMGSMLPQTGTAKGAFLSQADPLYAFKQTGRILLAGAGPALLLILLPLRTGAAAGVLRWAMPAFVALLLLYLSRENMLISTRYGTLLVSPILLAGALVLNALLTQGAPVPRGRLLRWSAGALVALQVLACVGLLHYQWPATRHSEEAELAAVARETHTLSGGQPVALSEVGIFGFHYDGEVADLVGLTDRTVAQWGAEHGRLRTVEDLEALLVHRGVEYYVDCFARPEPIEGRTLRFEPLREWEVLRPNLSAGRTMPTATWRLYRVVAAGAQ